MNDLNIKIIDFQLIIYFFLLLPVATIQIYYSVFFSGS